MHHVPYLHYKQNINPGKKLIIYLEILFNICFNFIIEHNYIYEIIYIETLSTKNFTYVPYINHIHLRQTHKIYVFNT